MRKVVLYVCLVYIVTIEAHAQGSYTHKSETVLAAMTPAQRVDEWVSEYVHHRYKMDDDHQAVIRSHVERDALKALPRLIEIIDGYDPTRSSGRSGSKGESFDASFQMLGYIDGFCIRLRSSMEGTNAIKALERTIGRMEQAGFEKLDEDKWEKDRLVLARMRRAELKGVNVADRAIRDTFRYVHKEKLTDTELEKFVTYLTENSPDYPSWSRFTRLRDHSQLNEAGNPLWIRVLNKPERYYEAYKEFKSKSH